MYTIYIELWKCDLLKATTDDAPDGDRTRDPSAKSLVRYRLLQPAQCIIDFFSISNTLFEPRREKTGLLPMRKQRRRSASQ